MYNVQLKDFREVEQTFFFIKYLQNRNSFVVRNVELKGTGSQRRNRGESKRKNVAQKKGEHGQNRVERGRKVRGKGQGGG